MEEEDLAADDQNGDKLELCSQAEVIHNPEGDLEDDGETRGQEVHRLPPKVCNVICCDQSCD